MVRLLRDRFFALDARHGCDLSTGDTVRLDNLPLEQSEGQPPAALVDVLATAQDGAPRCVSVQARNGIQASVVMRRAAGEARRRGFVPILTPLYQRFADDLAGDLEERALFLIAGFTRDLDGPRAALVSAAARSPRPHVLLTFHTTRTDSLGCIVREARATYGRGSQTRVPDAPMAPDVARHIARADRAAEFQHTGRHAAAERLLREVAGTLLRRQAHLPAARVLMKLGRLLLDRGRTADADAAFEEAAAHAGSAMDETLTTDARLWQAAARLDGARLTEAESICRAVLVAGPPSAAREAWALALLGRILRWQGRHAEAGRLAIPTSESVSGDLESHIAVMLDSTASRLLADAGDLFHAGLRVHGVLSFAQHACDTAGRIEALTAHLYLLAASGDLEGAQSRLHEIVRLARSVHTPLRAAEARLAWHDALARAGRSREAQLEMVRLVRMRRAMSPLMRLAIDHRAKVAQPDGRPGVIRPNESGSRHGSIAAELVRASYEEEDDARAVRLVIDRLGRELDANRVDLLSNDAGPVSNVASSGSGLPTHLGARVLEAGIVLPGEVHDGGHEIGLPIRSGTRLVAALVCRWPIDREPPSHAIPLMELVAAIAAPRTEALARSRRDSARAATSIPALVGASRAMCDVRTAIERAARAPFAVLVEGESGVGKELVARAIHQLSPRRERRFCDVNCAALPDDLLESELFGHARGAFTGAVADKPGLLEDADGGTLFLDEIPDLSLRAQAKLLRAIQQNEVRRVGETFSRPIEVRLVTAANRDMRVEAAEQRFRPDLLYRLDVIRIRIPALRERPEDIALLAEHFWRAAAGRVGSSATLTHGVLSDLARYHWPGNVRELQNVMSALAVAAPARGCVRPSLLPAAITGSTAVTSRRLADARVQFERRCVEVALARAGANRTRAAAELGLSRQGLLKTMARLGIESDGHELVPASRSKGSRLKHLPVVPSAAT